MPVLLITAIAIILFGVLFVVAMEGFGRELLESLSQFGFLARIFEVSFGIKIGEDISLTTMLAVSFTHGVVLTLSWGILIAAATRVTVGEIERGTADLLLTLPVTRSAVYRSCSLVIVLSAALISVCPLIGLWIGTHVIPIEEPAELSKFVPVVANFWAINLAIAGLAFMVGCLTNRRGIAVGIVIAAALVSAMLNFLEPFIEFIEKIRFLGLLNYYRPVDTVRSGEWPLENIAVLVSMAVIGWLIGLIAYCRKDIPVG